MVEPVEVLSYVSCRSTSGALFIGGIFGHYPVSSQAHGLRRQKDDVETGETWLLTPTDEVVMSS